MRTSLDHFGAVTEEDAAERDQTARDKERIYREVHPYIRGVALRLTTGRQMSDTQRRTVMSHMRRSLESGATVYRELYTSLTGDREFRDYAARETADRGTPGEAQRAAAAGEGLTAFQRTRLAEKIIDTDIARKIRTGNATTEEIQAYVERRGEEIRELDDEIKNLKGKLDTSRGETAEEHAEAETWRQQYHKARAELKAALKEARDLQRKLEQTRSNATARLRAGRENAEAKLKKQLAVKREAIKTLRKEIKEKADHARRQGRIETSWKWAEERAKLAAKEKERQQRIADRKAAARYLETNKKLAAYVMSADRIGMNVWVRQRELILGIQNALFETGISAARQNQLDAEIKDLEKKIEKEKKRLTRARDGQAKAKSRQYLEQYEAHLENLKSSRQYIEVLSPELGGIRSEQKERDIDTIDTGTVIYNGQTMSVEEFRRQFHERKIRYGFMDSKLRKAMRRRAQSLSGKRKSTAAILAKSLSQEDLLAIKEVIRQLNLEGRANWERRQFAIHLYQKDLMEAFLSGQDELVEEGKTRPAKRYIKAMQSKDIAERERLLAQGSEAQRRLFMSYDDKRLLQWMAGNKKRALYQFVIRDRIRYANRRDVAIHKRTSRILEIIGRGTAEQRAEEKQMGASARRRKIEERAQERIRELGERNITIAGIGPRNATRKWQFDVRFQLEAESVLEAPTDVQVSLADLMFLAVAMDNRFAREHYLYGNLWSDDERALYEPADGKMSGWTWDQHGNLTSNEDRVFFASPDGKTPGNVFELIKATGAEKEAAIRAAIDEHLREDDGKGGKRYKGDLLHIVDAIRDDFESHFHETRAVYEDMFNQVVEGQDNYLPLVITEGRHAQAEKENEIEALTQGSYQVRINPDKGMMLARVDIGPTHQTAIETDIFTVFFKGVEREEHFAKFAPYIRDLNTTLRGRNNTSKQLASKLTDLYGKWAVNRLYQHINMVGLPPSAKIGEAWENAADLGRFLSGNAGVAYIAYNIPAWLSQYPNSLAAFFGKADARFILSACLEIMKPGSDLVERVYEKSPKVRQRIINVAEEYRKHLSEQPGKFQKLQAKFVEIGMKGQRHADRTMVAAGWWALYQTALKKGKSEEDAVVFADEITSETQPDLSALETSPLYKDPGLGKLFLRFSQPLNVIWQNLTYDSFVSREKNFGSTVARLTAYGVAALIVAAMRGGLARQNDEDRDPDELARKVFYYLMVSNFAESTPLVGGMVSGTLEKLITGEGKIYQNQYFDLAARVLDIPAALVSENYERAIKDAMQALGLGTGLPVSQINRIIKAIQKENPWIIFGFDP